MILVYDIKNKEQCRLVQDKLFKEGYFWSRGQKEYKYLRAIRIGCKSDYNCLVVGNNKYPKEKLLEMYYTVPKDRIFTAEQYLNDNYCKILKNYGC